MERCLKEGSSGRAADTGAHLPGPRAGEAFLAGKEGRPGARLEPQPPAPGAAGSPNASRPWWSRGQGPRAQVVEPGPTGGRSGGLAGRWREKRPARCWGARVPAEQRPLLPVGAARPKQNPKPPGPAHAPPRTEQRRLCSRTRAKIFRAPRSPPTTTTTTERVVEEDGDSREPPGPGEPAQPPAAALFPELRQEPRLEPEWGRYARPPPSWGGVSTCGACEHMSACRRRGLVPVRPHF